MAANARARIEELEARVNRAGGLAMFAFAESHNEVDVQLLRRGLPGSGYELTPEEQERFTELWETFLQLWRRRIRP